MNSPTSPTSSEATVDEAEVLKKPPPSTYKREPSVIQTPLELNKRHKPSDTESPTIITTPLLGIQRTPETSFSGFSQQSGLHTNGKSHVEHEYPLPSPTKLFSIGKKNKRKTGGKTNKRLAKNMRRTYMARNRKNTKRRNTRRKNTRRRRKIRGGEPNLPYIVFSDQYANGNPIKVKIPLYSECFETKSTDYIENVIIPHIRDLDSSNITYTDADKKKITEMGIHPTAFDGGRIQRANEFLVDRMVQTVIKDDAARTFNVSLTLLD